MLPKRLFLLWSVCFLAASSAWADTVAYVDCVSHPDAVQVYGKPRQSQDSVASLPCGERFTVLVNGFIFSRIETGDGKIGYVLSSLISFDRSATSAQQANADRGITKVASASATAASSTPAPAPRPATPPVQPQSAPELPQPFTAPPQPAQAQLALAGASPAAAVSATAPPPAPSPATGSGVQPAVQPHPVIPQQVPAADKEPDPAASELPSPAPASPSVPTPSSATAKATPPAAEPSGAPATPPSASDPPSATVQTQPTPSIPLPPPSPESVAAPRQPHPASAEPETTPVRNPSVRSSWEKPIPGARRVTLLEFFLGFSLARFASGSGTSNIMVGGLGSFGINLTSWLQASGDSSYNLVTVSGTKSVLYGNHFGARAFYRRRNRWSITPFGEALLGGSRLDTTVSGVGGSLTSTNCLSYKLGGGVDLRASRHFEIRPIDFDFYRTAFGTGLHQNNYWLSAGVVLRLFGGSTQ